MSAIIRAIILNIDHVYIHHYSHRGINFAAKKSNFKKFNSKNHERTRKLKWKTWFPCILLVNPWILTGNLLSLVTERSLTSLTCEASHFFEAVKTVMTKAKIIDAAFRAWSRTFYQKTSLSQVARKLEVSKPALYRHFPNKKALIQAITECFLDAFANSFRPDYQRAISLYPWINSRRVEKTLLMKI